MRRLPALSRYIRFAERRIARIVTHYITYATRCYVLPNSLLFSLPIIEFLKLKNHLLSHLLYIYFSFILLGFIIIVLQNLIILLNILFYNNLTKLFFDL